MRILKNHYNGKDTIIGLGFIQNGCQFFNIGEADDIFEEHQIPKEIRDEVLKILNDESEKEKDLDTIQEYALSDNALIRRFVAECGIKEHLDVLVYDIDNSVRWNVAKHPYKDLLDILVNDNYDSVRWVVAKHNHKDLLDILVNDSSWDVRIEVAKHGHKEHLEILINDANTYNQEMTKQILKEINL